MEQFWFLTHTLTHLLITHILLSSSLSFTIQSRTLTLLSTLLSSTTSLSTSSISSSLHVVHLSSTLCLSSLCFLLLPFLPYSLLNYEFIAEFHKELWHLGAETRLMRGNYQDAELTNGLLPSFVSSWSPPLGVGHSEGVPQVILSVFLG